MMPVGGVNMSKFVAYDKMSKKQKAAIDKRKRKMWEVSPVAKVIPDKTKYNRKKDKSFREE